MFKMLNESSIEFNINDETRKAFARPSDTLLHVIREHLGLTGSKPGCENGDCGACTVMIDNLPYKSCLMLAAEVDNKKITTIEGLKNVPIQQEFIDNMAYQCGYCTSGFIMASQALINNHPNADDDTIEQWLQSNICRCTGYKEIKDAVKAVINRNKEKK